MFPGTINVKSFVHYLTVP